MAITATFSLRTGRLVLFGNPEAEAPLLGGGADVFAHARAGHDRAGGDADFDGALVNGGIGCHGLTITASSGRVRVMRGFVDQPRDQRGRRRRNG
jgi:hypothetical protein